MAAARWVAEALRPRARALKSGVTPTVFDSNQLIHAYAKHGLLRDARMLFDEMPDRNVFTWNAMISAHLKHGDLEQAQRLFLSAPSKDIVTYNSMLRGYASVDGYESHAVNLLVEMQGRTRCDEFSLTAAVNLAAKLLEPGYGRQLHCLMLKAAGDCSVFGSSSLIDMYSKCGCFREACRVFDEYGGGDLDSVSINAMVAACCREGKLEMAKDLFQRNLGCKDSVSWNTLISGFVQNGYEEEALRLFVRMVKDGVSLTAHTFASVLSACSGLKSLRPGKQVHSKVLKDGLILNPFISSGIVDVYCKCGNLRYAELVHAEVKTTGKAFSISSMIEAHSSRGNMVEARRLFDSLAERNSVVWTALFSGYSKLQQCEAVFELFNEYIESQETIVADPLIITSVLGACAIQTALDTGKQVHAYTMRMGIENHQKLLSAMVDMYSKCGNIAFAEKLFQKAVDKDSVLYNVMISGYGNHGREKEAIELFEEMLRKGIIPNAVTFVALLTACRHCGLVEAGEKYFYSMSEDYEIVPEIDHYTCMIDLYGRAKQLEKAVTFMKRVPVQLDAVIWGAFLNACKINQNVELAKRAAVKLLEIEGNNGARYVQLANLYASEGKWEEMGKIRKKMRGKEVRKIAGCSWVYVDNRAHTFTSGDTSCSDKEAIYSMLMFVYLSGGVG